MMAFLCIVAEEVVVGISSQRNQSLEVVTFHTAAKLQ
jgi:hypothetical protein